MAGGAVCWTACLHTEIQSTAQPATAAATAAATATLLPPSQALSASCSARQRCVLDYLTTVRNPVHGTACHCCHTAAAAAAVATAAAEAVKSFTLLLLHCC